MRSKNPETPGRHAARRFHFTTIFSTPSAPAEGYVTTYTLPDDPDHRMPDADAAKCFIGGYLDVKLSR